MTAPTEQKGFNKIRALAMQLQNAAYNHGCIDTQPHWSDKKYSDADDASSKALIAVIQHVDEIEQRLAEAEKERIYYAGLLTVSNTTRKERDKTITKLNQQLASAHQEARDQTNTACKAVDEQNRIWAELERVRNKLRIYGKHVSSCKSLRYLTTNPTKIQECDCGLNDMAAPQQEPKQ
jgi:hypothetical protein